MKKTFLLLSLLLVFTSCIPAFADDILDTDEGNENVIIESVLHEINELEKLHASENMSNEEFSQHFEQQISEKKYISSITAVDTINDGAEIKSINTDPTSIFITGIRSRVAIKSEYLDYSIPYTYLRHSDGAVFSGTLSFYYMRMGYIGPDPYQKYYQFFYEGDIPIAYYIQ